MAATSPSSERSVEWATAKPNGEGFFDNLVLDREQAVEYGDEMVMSLRVDGPILREREIISRRAVRPESRRRRADS